MYYLCPHLCVFLEQGVSFVGTAHLLVGAELDVYVWHGRLVVHRNVLGLRHEALAAVSYYESLAWPRSLIVITELWLVLVLGHDLRPRVVQHTRGFLVEGLVFLASCALEHQLLFAIELIDADLRLVRHLRTRQSKGHRQVRLILGMPALAVLLHICMVVLLAGSHRHGFSQRELFEALSQYF